MSDLERMADEILAEVVATARGMVALAVATDGGPDLTPVQQDAADIGIHAGFVATLEMLVHRGLLPSGAAAS